ncbi:MAG TPA: CHAT domain-containing tetratricopeptide repeat protein [Pirellulales bacterium]
MPLAAEPPAAAQQPAAVPAQPSAGDAARKQKIAERDRLGAEAQQFQSQGKPVEAIAAGEKTLAIERELYPQPHAALALILDWLGQAELERESFPLAEKRIQEALDIRTVVLGAGHWKVTDARLRLEHARLLAKLSPQDRQDLRDGKQANSKLVRLYGEGKYQAAMELANKCRVIFLRVLGGSHPDYAVSLNTLANLHRSMGDYARAEPLYKEESEILKRALGETHPHYAMSLNNLADLYRDMGDYARAEPLYKQSMEILKKTLGELDRDYAASLDSLAGLYRRIGDYARAEPLYRQAMEIGKQALGEAHPYYATSLNNLAAVYDGMGDYARAEPLLRKAMEIRKKALGEAHPDYATDLNRLALLYDGMGDYARAEPLLRKAMEIRKKALGEAHPDSATSLNNLASLYQSIGDYGGAEPLLRQALEVRRKSLGETHPDYAASLNNLAALYESMGDYAKAEPLYRRASAIWKKTLGEIHPHYAGGLNNLAMLYQRKGDYAQAEPLFRQALAIRKKVLGETHPDFGTSLNNLAGLYQDMGDYARAEPLYREAGTVTLKALEQSFLGESQRQQLAHAASVRYRLDGYLALQARHGADGGRVYPFWLRWKGLVLRHQLRQHALADRPELKPKFAKLEQVTTQLARLGLAAPPPEKRDAIRRQLAELSGRKEQLERDLAHQSAAFAAAAHAATTEELQQALPAETALVDFVEYWEGLEPEKKGGKPTRKRLLGAFIVRHEGPIQLVSLGQSRPVGEAIDRWRGETDGDFGRSPGAQAAGKLLREQVWQPVERLLAGAKLVLVSPDGPLDRLPFNALPGKEAGHYLLEDWAIAVIPSPAALAQPAPKPKTPPEGNLLVVADVDYNHRPGAGTSQPPVATSNQFADFDRGIARDANQNPWPPLEGTLGELAMLKQLYTDAHFDPRHVKTLSKVEATTAALREAASDYRYLHLATHGFFAAPRFHSALEQQLDAPPAGTGKLVTSQSVSGYHPGLLSGLVLAGANHPQPQGDNGYLTAEEVGTLDLRGVQLAVLSACETGLGNVAGGEGLLGLQRAFQAAGARTVVASLWRVRDQATRLLMERFYKNLWQQKPDQPRMTKLEALREAQLWMLREGGNRGLALEVQQPAAGPLPPYFWAAFVLSGDWR